MSPKIEKHNAPINSIIGAIFGTATAVSTTLRTNSVLGGGGERLLYVGFNQLIT